MIPRIRLPILLVLCLGWTANEVDGADPPWRQLMLGDATGQVAARDGAVVFTGTGGGYEGRADALSLAYVNRSGDFVFTARVTPLEFTAGPGGGRQADS